MKKWSGLLCLLPTLLFTVPIHHMGNLPMRGGKGPVPLRIEKKELTPCNDHVCEQVINARLRSLLLNRIYSFLEQEDRTVIITDAALGNNRVAGDTHFLNNGTWQITLNTDALRKASQEYIAATIIHELVHVYLNKSIHIDHDVMSRQYIELMAIALMNTGYHISYERARALAWGGLHNTRSWHEMRLIDRVLRTYKPQEIVNINYYYATCRMGVACP